MHLYNFILADHTFAEYCREEEEEESHQHFFAVSVCLWPKTNAQQD
jgi:hypothetical protein